MNVIMTTSSEIAQTKSSKTSSSYPEPAYIHDVSSPPSCSLMAASQTPPKPNPLQLNTSSSPSSLCRLPPSIESALLALSSASSSTDTEEPLYPSTTMIILENLKEWPYCPRKRRLEMCDSDSGSDIISVPLSKKWHEIASTSFSSLFDDDDTDTEDVNGCDKSVDATLTHGKESQCVNDDAKNHKRRCCAHLSPRAVICTDEYIKY